MHQQQLTTVLVPSMHTRENNFGDYSLFILQLFPSDQHTNMHLHLPGWVSAIVQTLVSNSMVI